VSSLLAAIKNIIKNPVTDLITYSKGNNRANNMGSALETYIKDVFCHSFHKTNPEKDDLYSQTFSYIGNLNNPPDIIIKNSDAVEIKKIESISSALALNSSYPKDVLHSHDPRITHSCQSCEETPWKQKDVLYTVGISPKGTQKLKIIWFVYGNCYAANQETYKRMSDKITNGINEISDIELSQTKELAKVKKIDPLGITDLRVRGMWHIENPLKVFKDIAPVDEKSQFTLHALMLEEKYNSFEKKDREALEKIQNENFVIKNVSIKSPNNPAKLLKARLISYVQ